MKSEISELSPSKNALKIANACEAYVMIFAGHLQQAGKRIKESGFDQLEGKYLFDLESHTYVGIYRVSQNPISIYSDFIRMTSARLYLGMYRLEDGLSIINEVLHNRTRAKQNKYQIESMLIKSILLQRLDQPTEALEIFHEVIHLASREGFIQIFLNEGLTIKNLLESVKENEIGDIEEQVFIIRLLEDIQIGVRNRSDQTSQDTEQLTPREIEVLECLSTDPSYSRAAELLSISRNTLKTHTKHIYQKLGVGGLLQALNKAKELEILS
jgi:LuxR family maltose regulon positive regulatory protein